jgi:membrane protein YdbS with pleckstrin-like domain
MSLEVEAMKTQPVGPKPMFSPRIERVTRFFALLILAVASYAVVYVPFVLLAPYGSVGVVALVVLGAVSMAGRLQMTRSRLRALEARLEALESARDAPIEAPAS